MFKMEEWKPIKDYENLYEVSNLGRIKSLERISLQKHLLPEKILKTAKNKYGYLKVTLHKNYKQKVVNVHRIVAETFIPNPHNLPCVNHIDGNKENNCVDNLEWCTIQENNIHAFKTGLKQPSYKAVIATNLQTGEEIYFNSLEETAQYFNLKNKSNISKVCRGKVKSLKGYTFKYTKE
jgi:hypothetical protein